MKITYLVHGTTTDNEKDIATGQNPGELSELGIEQSKEMLSKIKSPDFEVVFCSDLKRAIDTTNISFKGKYTIIQDKRLREVDCGDWNGLPYSKFKDEMEKYIDTKFPNGESYKDIEIRMRDFLEEIKKKYKHIAIVAHQAPQLALEVIANGKSWEESIKTDWRKVGKWQPGWIYQI